MAPRPLDAPPLSPTTSADPSRASSSSDGSGDDDYVAFEDIIVRIDTPPATPPADGREDAHVPPLRLGRAPMALPRSPLPGVQAPRGGGGQGRPPRQPEARRREIDGAAKGAQAKGQAGARRRFVPVFAAKAGEQAKVVPGKEDGRRFRHVPSTPNIERMAPWSPPSASAPSTGRRRFIPVMSAPSLAQPHSPPPPPPPHAGDHFAQTPSQPDLRQLPPWPDSPPPLPACLRCEHDPPSSDSPLRAPAPRRLAPATSTPALSSTPLSPPSSAGVRRLPPVASVPSLSSPREPSSPCTTEDDLSTRFNTRFSMHSADSFDIPGAVRVATNPRSPTVSLAGIRSRFLANARVVDELATRPVESEAADAAADAAARALQEASDALRTAVDRRREAQRTLLQAAGQRRTTLIPGRLARMRERAAAADAGADAAQRDYTAASKANGAAASRAAGLRAERDIFFAARKAQHEAVDAAFGEGGLPEEAGLPQERSLARAAARSAREAEIDATIVLESLLSAEWHLSATHYLLGGGGSPSDESLRAVMARGLSARFRDANDKMQRARLDWRNALARRPTLPLRSEKAAERGLLNSFVEIRAAVKEGRPVEVSFVERHAERVNEAVGALQRSLQQMKGEADIAKAEVKAAEAKAEDIANVLFERRKEVLFGG